jgi:hypothetical protein
MAKYFTQPRRIGLIFSITPPTGWEREARKISLSQQQLQEPQNRIIIDSPSHLLEHDMMSYRVEVGSQIKIDDVGLALKNCLSDALDRSVR